MATHLFAGNARLLLSFCSSLGGRSTFSSKILANEAGLKRCTA
ncbi:MULTISPECIES: hypothetical protein [unclassified Microcoleus]|nr:MULTISPECIES: hypothetical protein [unclassified Microcoleus]